MPELRDKFVICTCVSSPRGVLALTPPFVSGQVPCYTEGEESLKKTIDSLAVLTYDDKRKLLMIICDGMIIGSGNDRPTPRIVLDILGVDQSVDPDPLMFKSVSEGSKQLNYGKVWSGLYEVDGRESSFACTRASFSFLHAVLIISCPILQTLFPVSFSLTLGPLDVILIILFELDIVIAKVGRPSERSRPGNRGKRDSQILAMRFLNRVHFDSEMYPLELEMYHQIKNVIGVDPQLYEVSPNRLVSNLSDPVILTLNPSQYMLVIDADTSVAPDSLNRLVSCAADDQKIIGICGETKLENEQASWWTMIQGEHPFFFLIYELSSLSHLQSSIRVLHQSSSLESL